MIRIALCDDEVRVLEEVSACIEKYAQARKLSLEVVRFDSARLLKTALEEGRAFDMFLLDIYIGDGLGTDLARYIRKKEADSPIVFLTTSLQHAPESFETGTLRYLLKPLNPAKLYEALDAAIARISRLRDRQIRFKTENGVRTLLADHILCSEAHAHYQYITLEDGSQLKVRMTVTELYNSLAVSGGFLRVGSAYIINLRYVSNITSGEAHLYHGMAIPIPRGKANEIKKAFWDFQYEGQEE